MIRGTRKFKYSNTLSLERNDYFLLFSFSPKLKRRRLPDLKDVNGNPTAKLATNLEREMEAMAHEAMANRG